MYIIYILLLFLYSLIDINKYCAKFIVVSNNNGILKLHTNPISLTEAINVQKKLKTQHYYQTLIDR